MSFYQFNSESYLLNLSLIICAKNFQPGLDLALDVDPNLYLIWLIKKPNNGVAINRTWVGPRLVKISAWVVISRKESDILKYAN